MGQRVLQLPYCMPGFDLARLVQQAWAKQDPGTTLGIVLAHHGLFTFADRAQDAYDTHLGLVNSARRLIDERTGVTFDDEPDAVRTDEDTNSALRAFGDELRATTGSAVQLHAMRSAQIDSFLARPDLARVSQQGPSTLEHVIRTHRTPLLGRDVGGYIERYTQYFERYSTRSTQPLRMLDPTPRVILDDDLGLVTTGITPTHARVAEDIYCHTIRVITAAQTLGGYVSISPGQAFDIEYWELEQAKLR